MGRMAINAHQFLSNYHCRPLWIDFWQFITNKSISWKNFTRHAHAEAFHSELAKEIRQLKVEQRPLPPFSNTVFTKNLMPVYYDDSVF